MLICISNVVADEVVFPLDRPNFSKKRTITLAMGSFFIEGEKIIQILYMTFKI